jgi:hypothetical protein
MLLRSKREATGQRKLMPKWHGFDTQMIFVAHAREA